MLLDIFKTDAFGMVPLTLAVNDLPWQPTKIQKLGLFSSEGVSTLTVAIERQKETLTLVPAADRGAPGVVKGLGRRTIRNLGLVHLPQRVSVTADEVIGLRAFGSQTDQELAMARLMKKVAVARRDLDLTIEFQRMGAIKGQVLDADGSTVLYNLFTEFGLTQSTKSMTLGTDTTKVLQKVVQLKRMVEDKLGGVMMQGLRVECSPEFMDAFTGHPAVADAWRYHQSQRNTQDYRDDFDFGGVIWSEYRGQIGGTRFIAAGKAYAIPVGVPDLFASYFGPANYMGAGTTGLPFYVQQEPMPFDKGIDVEVQSNPLHICTRPDAIVELDMA